MLLALPAVVQAQFTFTTNNGAITITGYTGINSDVSIPSTTNGLPVNNIATRAFNNVLTLISVTIPVSVTNFGNAAFFNCTNLLGIYFQSNALPNASLAGGPVMLSGDNNATVYYLPGTTGWTSTFDFLPTVLWNPQVLAQLIYTTNNGAITITGYTGAGGAVVIPSTINGMPVTSIGSNAFFNCTSLTGMTFPNSITNLGNAAFAGCTSLTNIAIPRGVTGSGVFSNCTAAAQCRDCRQCCRNRKLGVFRLHRADQPYNSRQCHQHRSLGVSKLLQFKRGLFPE